MRKLTEVVNRIVPMAVAGVILATALTPLSAAENQTHVRRYLLSAGANNGGKERVALRYAVADANAFAAVFLEMGGVEKNNALVLANPNSRELLGGVANLGKLIAGDKAAEAGIRCEVFVYYSGHADDSGLKLGGETLPWSEFRNAVSGLDADVRVAVLDACGSGAITRTKGGVARPAFLSDASTNMKGYAFLTSSNENEASQESDRIKGSYFTHALLSGMRGAADMTGDGKVTINEAYQYAFNETLQSTQNTRAGTQHPSRDMNLAGTGDILMTDLRETGAILSLDANIEGRFFIRDGSGNLFAELRKMRGRAIDLGMPPGVYSVQMEAPSRVWMANDVEIVDGKKTVLTMNDMKAMESKKDAVLTRGDIGGGGGYGDEEVADGGGTVDIDGADDSLAASLTSMKERLRERLDDSQLSSEESPSKTASGDSLSSTARSTALVNPMLDSACRAPYKMNSSIVVSNSSAPESGVQLSLFVNTAGAEFCGTQFSLVANVASKDMNGAQISGGVNIAAERLNGIQAGMLNLSRGGVDGLQVGPVNISNGGVSLIQAGSVNIAKGYAGDIQAGAVNIAGSVGYIQGGSANIADSVGYIQGGAMNIAKSVGWIQAGPLNIANDVGYAQLGVLNIAGTAGAFQAGTLNIAKKTGRQIGVMNIAGHAERTPIGLLNIVGNGIFDAAFYGDACGDMGASVQTGTAWLYTAFDYQQPAGDFGAWPKAWGAGLGTRFGMSGQFFMNMDALWSNVYYKSPFTNYDEFVKDDTVGIAKFRIGGNYKVLPFLAVTAGVSANALFNFNSDKNAESLPNFNTGKIWREWTFGPNDNDYKVRVWPSFYAGLTVGKIGSAKPPKL